MHNESGYPPESQRTIVKLGIQRWSSRVKTPRDSQEIERFDETLEYEWAYNSNLFLDPEKLNLRLTEWLVEYNFNHMHQPPGYLFPIEYIDKELAKTHRLLLPI
jgi:transposase InsO family protein